MYYNKDSTNFQKSKYFSLNILRKLQVIESARFNRCTIRHKVRGYNIYSLLLEFSYENTI